MNTKNTLEKIGLIEVKHYLLMEEIQKGSYTRRIGHELGLLGETKYELIEQVKGRVIDLPPTEKFISQQKKDLPDRDEIAQLIEEFDHQYHNNFKTPLPSEVKDILKRLL